MEAELERSVEERSSRGKSELSARLTDAMRRLESGSVQKYRLRYALAKLTQIIELRVYDETQGTKWLDKYIGYATEHLFPQTPSAEAMAEFGAFENPQVAERLGNLLLVEKSINASPGNRAYSEKARVYPQSQLLLTRALSERPKVGVNTHVDAAVMDLEPFSAWSEEAVAARQDQLAPMARFVWNVARGR